MFFSLLILLQNQLKARYLDLNAEMSTIQA